ncbi:uncharacterized protein LOC132554226 [Ylistrum balloti]|uniref:uncharacterized protein LOC132554226 n=1 Tax=Ylistrum balloti TaxID=509963 RepID=UPI002905D4C5|nr:uncharacterized protein LOC132554226 [Ylistrum balloti]
MDGSGFAGSWVDDYPAGQCKGFEKFISGMELSDDEIKFYKGFVGSQITTVDDTEWSYTYKIGDKEVTNKFKINVLNEKDRDIEGNEFEMFPELSDDGLRLVENTTTWRPQGVFKTKMERILTPDGQNQHIVITNTKTGDVMEGDMHRVKDVQ